MNEKTRNRLTAWFDGESVDAAEMEAILEKDTEARAYIKELRQTREALGSTHSERRVEVPEWESISARLDEPVHSARVITFPKALGAIAAVMVLGIAIWMPFRQASINQSTTRADLMVNSVEMVETDLEGVTPVVYLDQPSGWTVVWVLEDAEPTEI